jgi:hypothetical protein
VHLSSQIMTSKLLHMIRAKEAVNVIGQTGQKTSSLDMPAPSLENDFVPSVDDLFDERQGP